MSPRAKRGISAAASGVLVLAIGAVIFLGSGDRETGATPILAAAEPESANDADPKKAKATAAEPEPAKVAKADPAKAAAPATPGKAKAAPEPQEAEAPADAAGEGEELLLPFQWGAALGAERCAFSGRPLVQMFVDEDINQRELEACLSTFEVEDQMAGFFVGALISPEDEAAQPSTLRRRTDLKVIVRGANGKFLGALGDTFTCDDLVALLGRLRRNHRLKGPPSPVYSVLLRDPKPVEDLVAKGDVARAAQWVRFLKEFEGAASGAAVAAEAVLPR